MKAVDLAVVAWRQVRALCPAHAPDRRRQRPRATVQVGGRLYCEPCAARLLAPAIAR